MDGDRPSPVRSPVEPPQAVRRLMLDAVEQGVFPGGQLAVSTTDRCYHLAVGRTALPSYPPSLPVTAATRFDVASLTKALCTSILLMQAVDRQSSALLDRTLDVYFPELPASRTIRIRDLAAHRAGLVAHRPFFTTIWSEPGMDPTAIRQRMRRLICAELLAAEPRTTTIYSDLGYILLGWVIEELFGQPLDDLFLQQIARPLGLMSSRFGPVSGPVAATEMDEEGKLLVGRVHDENCRALGGVAGHAGLFSTATEVDRILRHLAEVHQGAPGLVSTAVLSDFWRPIPGSSFTLGWDTPTEPSSSGRHMTRGASVGHLGFTGCSLWHDIRRDVTIVLLTNRLHPDRQNMAIRAFRPRLHDLVNERLGRT